MKTTLLHRHSPARSFKIEQHEESLWETKNQLSHFRKVILTLLTSIISVAEIWADLKRFPTPHTRRRTLWKSTPTAAAAAPLLSRPQKAFWEILLSVNEMMFDILPSSFRWSIVFLVILFSDFYFESFSYFPPASLPLVLPLADK